MYPMCTSCLFVFSVQSLFVCLLGASPYKNSPYLSLLNFCFLMDRWRKATGNGGTSQYKRTVLSSRASMGCGTFTSLLLCSYMLHHTRIMVKINQMVKLDCLIILKQLHVKKKGKMAGENIGHKPGSDLSHGFPCKTWRFGGKQHVTSTHWLFYFWPAF